MALATIPVDIDDPPKLIEPIESGFQIHRYRLTQGKQAGCELIVINSRAACAAICPTRGMSLWRAKLDSIDCQWSSPVRGPVHPGWVPVQEPSGLGWLDGFDELLVRCGLRSFGAPEFDAQGKVLFPLHGCVANLPAQNLELHLSDDRQQLVVSGDVYETRFLLHNLMLRVKYVFTLGKPTIEVQDQVTNLSDKPTTMQLLYHINVGRPLLDADCRVHLAADEVVARDQRAEEGLTSWDSYLGPTPDYAEQVYFTQPTADAEGWVSALLQNPSGSGFAVHYRSENLPCFTLWKNTAAEASGYVTGLEPGTGFPNVRSFETQQGRTVNLQPFESRSFELKLEATRDASRIQLLKEKAQSLRTGQPELKGFKAQWCTPR